MEKALDKFSIANFRDLKREELASFNARLYGDSFAASRFTDTARLLRLWKWQYEENPAASGIGNFGWLTMLGNHPVAQFHALPVDVKIGNNTYKAAWGINLATLPGYRGKGIASFLIKRAKEEAGRDFSLFLIGGMSPVSYRLFRKNNFLDLGGIRRYVRVLDYGQVAATLGLPRFLARAIGKITGKRKKKNRRGTVRVCADKSPGREYDEFWNSVSRHYPCIVRRNLTFLQWRYLRQPLGGYTILGARKEGTLKAFAVLREGRVKRGRLKGLCFGVIADILVDPEDKSAAGILLEEVAAFFRDKKMALIKCDITNGMVERSLLGARFMRVKSENGFMAVLYRGKMSEEDLILASSAENWFVSAADSDLDLD